jgi:alginate O-acetyltransferase complex protein AlgI
MGFWYIQTSLNRRTALLWLVACSFFFYGFWNPIYLLLILLSIGSNYSFGYLISRASNHTGKGTHTSRLLLTIGLTFNLGLLGYFKYANFFVDGLNHVFKFSIGLEPIILPLAISFFTFQQIAYLVDAYRDLSSERNFMDYCLFVTFFPQLIAGPIVHHKKMMPQFTNNEKHSFSPTNFAGGLTMFFLGLSKKVLLADTIATYSITLFDGTLQGSSVSFLESWIGTLAYTFQLYFDFSGYSDMAIGLALMFGIRLPMNFNSPYKSMNTADFWRRWHITLGHFLRDYLYIPLGGNQRGISRLYLSLMVTMSLSGLWHGAGLTFIFWGIQQGFFHWVYLSWSLSKDKLPFLPSLPKSISKSLACLMTFMAWAIGMVLFRAETMGVVTEFYRSMFGFNGFTTLPLTIDVKDAMLQIAMCFIIVWLLPNSQQIMARVEPVVDWTSSSKNFTPTLTWLQFLEWRPTKLAACILTPIAVYVLLSMGKVEEFLYFQF